MPIYCYYVYAYIRSKDSKTAKAGTPYYIGKGKGKRMVHNHGAHISTPKDKKYIIVMESNLSNTGALALERRYIKWFGRIDQQTGILHNKTFGGDGGIGTTSEQATQNNLKRIERGDHYFLTSECKQKVKNRMLSYLNPMKNEENRARASLREKERQNKIVESGNHYWQTEESKEHKRKLMDYKVNRQILKDLYLLYKMHNLSARSLHTKSDEWILKRIEELNQHVS